MDINEAFERYKKAKGSVSEAEEIAWTNGWNYRSMAEALTDQPVADNLLMNTPEWKLAERIFDRWYKNQLRPEGRAAIYIDDEAELVADIAEALVEATRLNKNKP